MHYAPHNLVDVEALGCDFLGCSAYKFYGPHIGILWGKRAIIESLDAPRLEPAPQESPERSGDGHAESRRASSAPRRRSISSRRSPADAHARAATRCARAFDALHARGEQLLAKLWNSLAEIDGLTLYGPKPGTPRTPTLSFTLRGHTTDDVATALAKRGVFVSNGDFYAATVIERLGVLPHGLVRVGCSCYTSESEVDRLIEAWKLR